MSPPLALQQPEAIAVAPTRFRLMNLSGPFVILAAYCQLFERYSSNRRNAFS